MEWTHFRDWCLADYGKAKATVYYNEGRARTMQRMGLDIDRFLSAPAAAREEGRHLIANLKLAGKSPHMIRTYQKVLNWLLDYAKSLQPNLIWGEAFELAHEPKSRLPTVPEHRVHELWTYAGGPSRPSAYAVLVRRAVAWVGYWTRLRRSEVARLEDPDLDADQLLVKSRNPAKRGIPNERVVPDFFFAPELPLGQYLAVRVAVPNTKKLWTRIHGHTGKAMAYTPSGLYNELFDMGQDLRMRINFIATRRAGSTMLDEHGVHPRVGAAQNGQNAVASWERYVGGVTTDRARREFGRVGVPGFSLGVPGRALGGGAHAVRDPVEPRGDVVESADSQAGEKRVHRELDDNPDPLQRLGIDRHGDRDATAPTYSYRTTGGPQKAPGAAVRSASEDETLHRRPVFFPPSAAQSGPLLFPGRKWS